MRYNRAITAPEPCFGGTLKAVLGGSRRNCAARPSMLVTDTASRSAAPPRPSLGCRPVATVASTPGAGSWEFEEST
jgi:hypothetical protein